MKFLLLNIETGFEITTGTKKITSPSPPLGLLYIARSLEDEGHNVKIIDFSVEKNPKKKLEESLNSVDAIGVTVYTSSFVETAEILDNIKKNNPDLPIIIGGPHCTFHPKQALLDIPTADISVEGEGEQVIKEIVKVLEGRKKISELEGTYYREKNEIKTGKPAGFVKDIELLPFPSRHLVEKYDYGKLNKFYFYKPKFSSIITTRGCPYRCRFCTRHITSMKKYRTRSAENVLEELLEINDKYNSVMAVDDSFLADNKRAHKIMDGIIENGIEMDLYIQARVDSYDQELYKKMKKAGVKHLYFGIESGNQDVLDFYNKRITLDQVRKTIKLSNQMNFLTRGSFIIGAPIETKEHVKNTINFARSLPLDLIVFNILCYQHGSDLWLEAVESKKIKEDQFYSIYADSKRGLGKLTYDELEAFCQKAFNSFYFRPSYILRQIFQSFIRKDFSMIRAGLDILMS